MHFLSARQVAGMFGVPYYEVLPACQKGELPCQRMGANFAIQRTDAEAWAKDWLDRRDPNSAHAMKARIKELEDQVKALEALVKALGGDEELTLVKADLITKRSEATV